MKVPDLKTIDLAALNQQQTAWLLSRSPRWLRDQGHRFKRDARGKYDAREAVATLLKITTPPITDFYPTEF
jgi:hypothetical protein